MSLLDIPLERITESDLQTLIEVGTPESVTIDYKRDTYADNVEFLKDISSFANARGGEIIIGMDEDAGLPTRIVPLHGNSDNETLRLIQISRGLEPRLLNFQVRAVPIAAGGFVIVIRIGSSFSAPHRISAKGGHNRFWLRSSAGKFEPDISELRRLFLEGPQLVERIRDFRAMRVGKILAGETPITMRLGGKVVTHVVSLPAFADNRFLDVVEVLTKGTHMPLPPSGQGHANATMINLDGLVNYQQGIADQHSAYAQLFRIGALEGSMLIPSLDGRVAYYGVPLANTIVSTIKQHMDVLRSLDAGSPMFAFVSLCGVRNSQLLYSATDLPGQHYAAGNFQSDVMSLPDVLLDGDQGTITEKLRPILNMIWNAYGLQRCEAYDAQGNWRGIAQN